MDGSAHQHTHWTVPSGRADQSIMHLCGKLGGFNYLNKEYNSKCVEPLSRGYNEITEFFFRDGERHGKVEGLNSVEI